jgi:hypothetical protein
MRRREAAYLVLDRRGGVEMGDTANDAVLPPFFRPAMGAAGGFKHAALDFLGLRRWARSSSPRSLCSPSF